jgi:acyl carrier protein
MNNNEIIEKIDAVLAEEFEVDPGVITPDAPLMATLDMDSLDLVDVVVLVEQNFGITLKGEDFVGLTTFQNFYDLIFRKLGA